MNNLLESTLFRGSLNYIFAEVFVGVPGVLMVNQGGIFTKPHNETFEPVNNTVIEPSSQEVLRMSPFLFGVLLSTTSALTEAGVKGI